jgi:hypothetical protein
MVDLATPGMNGLEVIDQAKRSRRRDVETSKDRAEGYAAPTRPLQIGGELARHHKSAMTRPHV